MTIIYAVNSGQYSDFGYNGVFSTREKAEAYMVTFPKEGYGGYNEIEELELDLYISEIDKGLILWRIRMYNDGEVYEIERSKYPGIAGGKVSWMTRAYWDPQKPWANFYCWAKDGETAIKIANERRVQDLALNPSADR